MALSPKSITNAQDPLPTPKSIFSSKHNYKIVHLLYDFFSKQDYKIEHFFDIFSQ